jgi:hypothetical protein
VSGNWPVLLRCKSRKLSIAVSLYTCIGRGKVNCKIILIYVKNMFNLI